MSRTKNHTHRTDTNLHKKVHKEYVSKSRNHKKLLKKRIKENEDVEILYPKNIDYSDYWHYD